MARQSCVSLRLNGRRLNNSANGCNGETRERIEARVGNRKIPRYRCDADAAESDDRDRSCDDKRREQGIFLVSHDLILRICLIPASISASAAWL